ALVCQSEPCVARLGNREEWQRNYIFLGPTPGSAGTQDWLEGDSMQYGYSSDYSAQRIARIQQSATLALNDYAGLQYWYIQPVNWPDNANANSNRGRLNKVIRYPDGNGCGTGLTTTYDQYTVEGLPTSVTTPDGVVHTFIYDLRGRITTSTVGTTSYVYTYDDD